MTLLQDQIDAEHPELALQIVHVNRAHRDDGVPDLSAITDLPVVQDDDTVQVWERWGVTWRDFVVLDRNNRVYAVYNLTDHDLDEDANYVELASLLVAAAEVP